MRLIITLTLTLFLGMTVAALPGAAVPHDPVRSNEPKTEFTNRHYPAKTGNSAIVTEVTKDSITVRCGEEKPKRFAVSDVLAAGKISNAPRPGYPYFVPTFDQYRLTDVKVGDWVNLRYARVDGVDVCDHICIEKRPGGLVPPLPDGVETPPLPFPPELKLPPRVWIRYHDWQNAHWDFEDRGIPYPAKFGIVRYHTAPMPREVKRGPAIAP
jgi:hypothetical protein